MLSGASVMFIRVRALTAGPARMGCRRRPASGELRGRLRSSTKGSSPTPGAWGGLRSGGDRYRCRMKVPMTAIAAFIAFSHTSAGLEALVGASSTATDGRSVPDQPGHGIRLGLEFCWGVQGHCPSWLSESTGADRASVPSTGQTCSRISPGWRSLASGCCYTTETAWPF